MSDGFRLPCRPKRQEPYIAAAPWSDSNGERPYFRAISPLRRLRDTEEPECRRDTHIAPRGFLFRFGSAQVVPLATATATAPLTNRKAY
jgi:hypothetical protein